MASNREDGTASDLYRWHSEKFVCHGVPTLLIEKFSDDEVSVRADGTLVVSLSGTTHELSRAEAVSLRGALDDSLVDHREFVHTAGTHRADGTYVVSRRGADSAGHRKVFDSFACLRERYETFPKEFTAEDVGSPGLTGGRRHLVLRHLAEHPAFDCALARRQPLTARKGSPEIAPDEL